MNHNHVFATIGTRAVDPRMFTDDKFLKRMGNFDRVCKQIDAKHDHVMEMLANIQEQLRTLEMKQMRENGVRFCAGDAQFQNQMAAIKPTPSLSPLFSTFQPSPQTPPPPSQMEAIKPSLLPPYIISEIDVYEDAEMLVDEHKVFDEIHELENSKISVISPLVHGSEIAEVYDFGVLNPQFQTPLVSIQEIKMEPEGLSLISSPSSFSSNSDGTKLEDKRSVEVPIYTTVVELQPQESESGFEVFPKPPLVASKFIDSIGKVEALSWPLIVPKAVEEINFIENPKMMDNNSIHVILCRDVRSRYLGQWQENSPNLSIRELFPSGRIIVSSLLHSPFLYNCYNGDGLTKEELKWLDTGQYLVVSDFSRYGVGFDLIVCWNLMNKMCWDKNTLVSGMQLKDSWSEWGEIKIVVRGANNHEQNSGALRIQELVDCVSLYVMNFTCLAFAYDPSIYCMCWNESFVHFLKIQLDNSATSNHKIGLYGVKMVNNVSICHNSLANPTVGLEDAMPLHEISSLHIVCCPTKHVTSREIRCKNRKKEMRWYLMAFNGHLHYSDVFFKPSKHQFLKCVMNDSPSWSVKVLNSSEETAVEQRHVLEVLDDISSKQLGVKIKEYSVTAPDMKNSLSGHYALNLVFRISIEPSETSLTYKCPETAQTIQIRHAFGNEFSPRQGLLGVCEFTLVEFEHFVYLVANSHTKFVEVAELDFYIFRREYLVSRQQAREMVIGEAISQHIVNNVTVGYFVGRLYLSLTLLGLDNDRLWFRQHLNNEMTNNDADCWDVEIECTHGWTECVGIVGSTYDLHAHTYKCGVWRFRELHSKFFRIIQGVLSWKKVGEAFGGLGLDQLLTVWLRISLGNEHMIQNSHAGKDPVIVPTCQHPPSKPPFQFLRLSLGDKTHSRGEYCHIHDYGGIRNKERRREINGSVEF